MKKNIIIFACIEKNIGDDLFIKILCDRYPNVNFTISSAANYGLLSKIKNLDFSGTLQKWIKYSNNESENFFKYKLSRVLTAYYGIQLRKYDGAVYIVGNAFKNYNYSGKKQSQWIKDRMKLTSHFYLLSTNFGPYKDERWKNDFDDIFPMIDDVCFREKKSYELFSWIDNVRYAPDAVLSLGYQHRNNNDENIILISIIDCLFEARPIQVKNKAERYEKAIVDIASNFIRKGFKVVLINSNTIQDEPASERIINQIEIKDRISVFDYDGNLESVFELFSKAKYVLASRLHTIILGWLYRLPVIPIVYDTKVSGIIKSCNYNGPLYDLDTIRTTSPDYIYDEFNDYDFVLSESVIRDAKKQFMKLDEYLWISNVTVHHR